MKNLPLDAERSSASNRRFKEVVVFVPQYGGDKRHVARHAQLVNELGFDCIRLNLPFDKTFKTLPITADLRLGVRHVWAEQLEQLLNLVGEPKIIYSFSMPSGTALEAMAHRRAHDIKAWICDGGPFLELFKCSWNLYEQHYKVRSRLLKAALTVGSIGFWGLRYREELRENLAQLPEGFPVLSIRGAADPIVPPSAIAEVFSLQDHLNLKVFEIPKGGHLNGLKTFNELYSEQVKSFLEQNATLI